jgi:hypothetical protein
VKHSNGDVLYFVHADTRPPRTFPKVIAEAIKADYDHGSFRTRFASGSLILKVNAWCTRFDKPFFRGGDQSIWVTRELFERSGRLQGRDADHGRIRPAGPHAGDRELPPFLGKHNDLLKKIR